MFATLVVVLPGDYSGGELVIRHRGKEARIDLHRDEPSEAAFAAFYADCLHEVLPIASGHRLALVYNLVRLGRDPLPQEPDDSEERKQLAGLLRDWAAGDGAPDKLVYPLDHAYTEAEIAFDTLKGRDSAAALVLASAAEEADCGLHLALISAKEAGWAEYTGGGRWDDPELEVGEVDDREWRIHDRRSPGGVTIAEGWPVPAPGSWPAAQWAIPGRMPRCARPPRHWWMPLLTGLHQEPGKLRPPHPPTRPRPGQSR